MSSIFSRIARGEIPSHKIAEDDRYFAFLDIHPVAEGHTLVIPKEETDYLFDIDDEAYAGLMLFAKRIARAVHQAIPCKRVGVAVLGLEVPHAHVHLVPLTEAGQIDFSTKLEFSSEALAKTAARIRQCLDA